MRVSTSNDNWVCFDCRLSFRKPKRFHAEQSKQECTSCGELLVNIGYRIDVPKKSDDKGWKQLKGFIRSQNISGIEDELRDSVRVMHDLEKEINKEESKDFNKDRSRQIATKKAALASIKAKLLNIG